MSITMFRQGLCHLLFQTPIDLHSLPMNTTLLYLRSVTSIRRQEFSNDTQSTFIYLNLSLLNMTNSGIVPQILHNFLQLLPKLRVLLLRHSSITNLR